MEQMLQLACVECGQTKVVEDKPVAGQPMRDWWASVGRRCKDCREGGAARLARVSAPAAKLRNRARDTEIAAAVGVLPRTGTQRRRVLQTICDAGEHGATDAEIVAELGLLENSERPRRVELVEQGWIADSGLRRASGNHNEGIVWVLTDYAKGVLCATAS